MAGGLLRRFAAEAFSHANKIDKRVWGKPGAKIGFVAAGKNWLDLVHALGLLGIDAEEAERLGITTYKIGQTFPLDMKGFHEWAEGLDLIANLRLANSNPAVSNYDEQAISKVISEAINVSRSARNVILQCDTFEDVDRGYSPRYGLVDRLGNLRSSFVGR